SARPIFDQRNVEDGKLQSFTYLLRCQPHAIRRVHCFDHVCSQFANPIIYVLDRFAFRPQDRVAVLQDRQNHFSSRVNAGKFLTPASFNASMTLIIVPKDAFLSAWSASVDLRVSGRFRTAPSSSSTPMVRPSSLISSF